MSIRSFLLLLFVPAAAVSFGQYAGVPIDRAATAETKALYHYLKRISGKHILFGHQHATEYGHGWWGDADRSDVKSVTGSHPAVIGVDFSGLSGRPDSLIEKEKSSLRKNIAATYDRGGITTVVWHFPNPVSGNGFYAKGAETLRTVGLLIPGGAYNQQYKEILRTLASVINTTRGQDGKLVPMIFRPYHEFDGDWFWWGRPYATIDEFKTLWHFTVSYLRDSLSVHTLLYAFSPDNRFHTEPEFLERYPGDAWVDMVGMDNYGDFGRDGKYDLDAGLSKLQIVCAYAKKAGKLAAFTETGLESIPKTDWWTGVLLKTLRSPSLALCYVLVWRNDSKSPTHFYAPFPGQASAADFVRFFEDDYTYFERDLKGVYKSR